MTTGRGEGRASARSCWSIMPGRRGRCLSRTGAIVPTSEGRGRSPTGLRPLRGDELQGQRPAVDVAGVTRCGVLDAQAPGAVAGFGGEVDRERLVHVVGRAA